MKLECNNENYNRANSQPPVSDDEVAEEITDEHLININSLNQNKSVFGFNNIDNTIKIDLFALKQENLIKKEIKFKEQSENPKLEVYERLYAKAMAKQTRSELDNLKNGSSSRSLKLTKSNSNNSIEATEVLFLSK